MNELTEEEITYLNKFGFEPIIKVKSSPANRTFTVDIYAKLLDGGNYGSNSNNTD